MSTIPSPEQFLAAPPDPDEDESSASTPLESIAESLRGMHVLLNRWDAEHQADVEEEKLSDRLRERQDDLDAEYNTLYALVEEIEAVIKPSTSKLANSVREVIGRWKNPKVEPVDEEPAAETPPVIATVEPEPDADVEAWRAYARGRGYTGADVDRMNRSQIRTVLGIEQPTGGQ